MNKILVFAFFIVASMGLLNAQNKEISFKIKNAGFNVEGIFEKYKLDIVYNESNLAASKFNGNIEVVSINTDSKKRDNHLRNTDYFDAVKYPSMTFKSTSISSAGAGKILVSGDLTIKNVTKKVSLTVAVKKVNGKTEFTASLPLNRRDYGVGGSSFILSDKLVINLKITQ